MRIGMGNLNCYSLSGGLIVEYLVERGDGSL